MRKHLDQADLVPPARTITVERQRSHEWGDRFRNQRANYTGLEWRRVLKYGIKRPNVGEEEAEAVGPGGRIAQPVSRAALFRGTP